VTETGTKEAGELGFDQVLERLRAVVERLEQGNLSLEDSLHAYEEGVGLARRGHTLLDGAEKRVEILMRGGRTAPLDGEGEGEGEGDGAGEHEQSD
jgi:exodeoxyribonuclease VII small subunit